MRILVRHIAHPGPYHMQEQNSFRLNSPIISNHLISDLLSVALQNLSHLFGLVVDYHQLWKLRCCQARSGEGGIDGSVCTHLSTIILSCRKIELLKQILA